MPLDGLTVLGCKGLFSRPSRLNRLGAASSHVASMLLAPGLVQSWPKAALAAFFFALTNYVIFEDVLRHGAPITTDHLLSFGVLVGITSAGRNAAALTAKVSEITAQDGPRAALERQVKDAEKEREIISMRASAMSAYVCTTRLRSRASQSGAVITSARPSCRAASRSTMRPPSDDSRPASKVAVSALPPTGDRPGRMGVAFMAVSWRLRADVDCASQTKVP